MFAKCERCNGSLHTRMGLDGKETSCLSCGYESIVIQPDVQAEVEASYGKAHLHSPKPKFNVREQVD